MNAIIEGVREHATENGYGSLSDRDLLALLTSESAADAALALASSFRGLRGRRVPELVAAGVPKAMVQRILAATEIGLRLLSSGPATAALSGAGEVAARCARYAGEKDEVFIAIGVNARNRVTGEWVVARGWESGVNMTPRQVFSLLIKEGVTRVVFVHNHPSGDPAPSVEDSRFTQRLIDGATILGIKVLDHVIVATDGHVSIRDVSRGQIEFA